MLAGSGTAGAYHAGVLRALHEAGIKIDLVAGRGAGVIGAMFAAMDGGARLWDDNGVWRRPAAGRFYRWRRPLRIAGWALAGAGVILALPIALLVVAMAIALAGMLLTFIGLESAGTAANAAYSRWIETLFAPGAVPTYVPRLAVLATLLAAVAAAASVVTSALSSRAKRRTGHGLAGRLIGGPLSATALVESSCAELWNLIRDHAAGVAIGGRARAPLCRARGGESRSAGIP